MTSQTSGVQQLLAAEKRASDKVADARKRKVRLLKQAKQEAQAEVEKYRQRREEAFKAFESERMGSKAGLEDRIEQDTIQKLEAMRIQVEQHEDEVITSLLERVCDIKPELHRNYRRPNKASSHLNDDDLW
ncbi:putative V-type proton ATPase subunit G [Orchesella cincta]|uniref:V-type proton ATPase subunit G n=1 Tax=Orchesella cincta TaxID=48709 RepID=A0A1D2M7L0_ORCCI|nr:putative V-type proton ATPase subunit G [Orchesella cincta]